MLRRITTVVKCFFILYFLLLVAAPEEEAEGDTDDDVLQRALRKAVESGDTDLVGACMGGCVHGVCRGDPLPIDAAELKYGVALRETVGTGLVGGCMGAWQHQGNGAWSVAIRRGASVG